MTDFSPFPLDYDGEVFRPPSPFFAKRARDRFAKGRHLFVEHLERSTVSHQQQFAWLKEAWSQLPENLADLYPTPEHLRKRALIEAGYFNEEAIDCGTKAAALKVASFIRRRDDFALAIVRGPVILVRTAKSQSYRAMPRGEFQASKSAIMEIIAAMIDVPVETLKAQAGQAA